MAEVDISAVFHLLGNVAADIREHGKKIDVLTSDMADVKHGLAALDQRVAHYHAAVLGHGVLITELDERLRRVERHLGLPPAAAE